MEASITSNNGTGNSRAVVVGRGHLTAGDRKHMFRISPFLGTSQTHPKFATPARGRPTPSLVAASFARPALYLVGVLALASCGDEGNGGGATDGASADATVGADASDGATGGDSATSGDGPAGADSADGSDGGPSLDPETPVGRLRLLLEEHGVEPLEPPPEVSDELYELGQALSFDKLLSGNHDISCMTCHHPTVGSDDDLHLSLGVGGEGLGDERSGGEVIARNAQALFNLHLYENMFWDGRVELDSNGQYSTPAGAQLTPEMIEIFDFGVVSAQAMFPVTDAHEMRGAPGTNELADLAEDDFAGIWAGLMTRIGGYPEYVEMFELAYPGESFEDMSFAHAGNAIAAFEIRGFDTRDSPWNRFVVGDDEAMPSESIDAGIVFYDVGCGKCHSGSETSDFEFHTLAIAQFGPGKGHGVDGNDDYGREGVTGNPEDRYDFRTPPLFNVELTSPYGHTGQIEDIFLHIRLYTNLGFWRRGYEISNAVSDDSLWPTLLENEEEVIDALEADLRLNNLFDDDEQIVEVRALADDLMVMFTDDRARNMADLVPESVPSNLPVDD